MVTQQIQRDAAPLLRYLARARELAVRARVALEGFWTGEAALQRLVTMSSLDLAGELLCVGSVVRDHCVALRPGTCVKPARASVQLGVSHAISECGPRVTATLTLRRQQRRAEAESKSKLDARPGWDITTTTPTIVRKVPPPRFNSRAPPPPRRKKRTPRRTTDSSPPVSASAVSPDGAWAALFAADAAAAATAEAQPWTPEPERVPAEALQAVRAGVAQDVQPDEVKLVKEVDKLALRPAVASALKGIKSRMLRRRAVHEQLFAWMDDPATQEEVAVATDGGDTASDGGVQQARPLSVHTNGAGGAAAAGEASPRSTGSGAAKRLRRRRVARKQGQQRPGWNATTLVEPPKRALVHTILKDDDLELMLAQEEKPAKEFPEELYYASVSDQLRGEVMQAVEDEEFLQRCAGVGRWATAAAARAALRSGSHFVACNSTTGMRDSQRRRTLRSHAAFTPHPNPPNETSVRIQRSLGGGG